MSSPEVGKEKRGSGATVRACDSCRRRKRRCVYTPGAESCTPCLVSEENCSTTHIRKPRAKSQKRTNRITEYENRIQRLESLLEERSAAQPQVQEQPLQPADPLIPLSDWVSNLRDEIDSYPLEEGPHIGAEGVEAGFEGCEDFEGFENEWAFSGDSGQASLLQPSPEFPLLNSVYNPLNDSVTSPEIYDPVTALQYPKTQGGPMQITHVQPPITRAQCDGYLPPPELGTSLLSEFLVDFNTAVPLYRPYVITEHLRKCYAGGSGKTAVAWASTYVVFGIAHRLRAMSAAATPRDNEQADYYMSHLLQTVPNLLLEPPSLGLIQCLLGLATLIQTSSHSTPHALFVSTALRMAQCLAYNDDKQPLVEDSNPDVEQQRRVFWIAFFKDTDESILSNAPTTHRREDIGATRPEDDPQDAAGAVIAAEGTWRVNIFSLRTQLALLQAEAVEKVLSLKARTSQPEWTFVAVRTMLQKLQDWRNHALFQLNAEQLMQLLYRSDLVHVLGLEASYFATVFRLQAFLVLGMDTRANPFSADVLARLVEPQEQRCFQDAKRFLDLLAVVPQGDIGVSWAIKQPVIAALCTVLAHSIHSTPSAPPSQTGMREYSKILHMLNILSQKAQDSELQKARDLCMALFSRVDTARRVRDLQNLPGPEMRPFQGGAQVIFS